MEACFYECDHNMGKYRKYPTCIDAQGDQNGWQINGLPLQATMVNNWWAACKNDLFCTGDSGSYFDLPSLTCVKPVAPANETATCRKFSNIYTSPQDMITKMWDGSFSVADAGKPGFVFPAPGAAPFVGPNDNPNNAAALALNVSDPPFCPFRTAVNGTAQALADLSLYVRARVCALQLEADTNMCYALLSDL
jgi:folate receptor